jgi:pimeloyl-ACP methyl ester carboxylesterase
MSDEALDFGGRPPARRLALSGRGGLRLVGDAWGDPGHPPVLLLHGGGQTRHAWGGTAEALAREGWHAVSLDLRGHGESEWAPDSDYGADAFVDDVRAVVNRFERAPALVGASLGGIASLLAEAESPRSICSALVLVDVAPRIEARGAVRIMNFMTARPEGFANLEEAADAVAAYLPHRRRPRDLSGLRKNLRLHEDGRLRWHWDPAFMRAGAGESAISRPDRLREAARAVRVPTLLVRGRLSDLLSEEGAREFLELVPHARFRDVSGAGHMVAGDRNDRFTDTVLTFLRECPGAPRREG